MLSYRHAFHAGNFADVLKHQILIEVMQYLGKKPKGFDYIDTHAGAGLYQLDAAEALKTGEFQRGIGHWLSTHTTRPEGMEQYLALIEQTRNRYGQHSYPGSPLIAAQLLRPQDKAWLYELHPADFRQLRQLLGKTPRCHIQQADGFAGLSALLPTPSRRALVLIDPSYEVKSEYRQVVDNVAAAHRKMATATFLIWYPVVAREQVDQLQQAFTRTGLRRIQQFELGICDDGQQPGMTSAGLFVVNPPWPLQASMETLLPQLAAQISVDGRAHFRCEVLVGE